MPQRSMNNSKPNLTDDERNGIVQYLLQRYADNKLEQGALSEAADKFLSRVEQFSMFGKERKNDYNLERFVSMFSRK